MSVVTLEDAQGRLGELIARLKPDEVIHIVDRGRPVARLVGKRPSDRPPRRPGSAIGQLVILSDDDEHLKDFSEYLPGSYCSTRTPSLGSS
jgi:prevent-host-death family protein